MIGNIVIFSDFDGTLTYRNVLDWLYETFAGPCQRDLVDRWERGEISIKEELEGCFANVKANRTEMELFLNHVRIRPGLPYLINYCQERAYGFAILSEGLEWYIEYILRLHDIFDVTIYANQILFGEDRFRFSFPWFDPHYPLRGTSKVSIIRKYQSDGKRVIFIGDGLSDTEAAGAADIVFARDTLLHYTSQHGIDSIKFSTISGIIRHLERLRL